MRRLGRQHLLFPVNQVAGVEGGDFEPVTVGDGIGGTGLHAIAAEDTPVVVDVIDLGVPLRATNPVLRSVLSSFDVYAIRGASRGAQEAGDALFQTVFVTLEDVNSPETLLKLGALQRARPVGIILHNGGLEHLPEGDAHSFSDSRDVLEDRHISPVYRKVLISAGWALSANPLNH